jgi:hypothetical protein
MGLFTSTMTLAYKVLICQRATGHVLNADAKADFLWSALPEATLPYVCFDTLSEAERFAWQLHKQNESVEMAIYLGKDYIQLIPPVKAPSS